MKDLENNKLVAAVIVAALIAVVSGKMATSLYHGEDGDEKRGYQIEVAEEGTEIAPKEEAPIDIAALLASADSGKGVKTFKKCASCHSIEPNEDHKLGPNLAGIFGAAKGHHADYSYSDALKVKGGTWDEESLFVFIKRPKDYIPGTKMTFAGISKPEQIANLIAYMKTK